MTNSNGDLEKWRLLWQAEPDNRRNAAEVGDRVVCETRRRKLMLVVPIVVTIAIGGWTTARALASTKTEDIVFAGEAWLFITIVWIGSLWIDRGTWRPLDDSTSDFLELAIRRCHAALKAVRFGIFMYVIQLVTVLGWKAYYSAGDPATLLGSWSAVLFAWIGLPLLIGLAVWYRRNKLAELQQLIDLREEWRRE